MTIPVLWETETTKVVGKIDDDGVMELMSPPDGPAVTRDAIPSGVHYEVLEKEEVGTVEYLKKLRIHAFSVGP